MELNFRTDESGGSAVLAVAGDCRVDSAAALREALSQALLSYDTVALDVAGVTDLDISFLQLLLSAAKTAKAKNKSLTWEGELPQTLKDAARVCGFNSLPELKLLFFP